MSHFQRLDLDEAGEYFPLLNEEARKVLRGGCTTCDQWREEYPGISIYSMEEYESMCAAGKWKGGAVCGIGLNVLAQSEAEGERPGNGSHCGIHFWPFGDKECEYCYFDSMRYCDDHKIYFGTFGYCEACLAYENYESYYSYENTPSPGNNEGQVTPPAVEDGNNNTPEGRPEKIDFTQNSFTALTNWLNYVAHRTSTDAPLSLGDIMSREEALKNGFTQDRTYGSVWYERKYNIDSVGSFTVKVFDAELFDTTYGKYDNSIEYMRCMNNGTEKNPDFVFRVVNSNNTVLTVYCGPDRGAFLWLYKNIYGENTPVSYEVRP